MNNVKVEFHWKRARLFDQRAAQSYHDVCLENPVAKVENCKSKPKSKWRPLPMDTVVSEGVMGGRGRARKEREKDFEFIVEKQVRRWRRRRRRRRRRKG